MISKDERERLALDASRYMMEMKREALTTLVPHPDEKEERIDLITFLRGKRPNMYKLFRAKVQQDGLIAMSLQRPPNLGETADILTFLRSHSTSLDGFRSKQVVEIAKSESHVQERSILDFLRRKRG